MEKLLLCHFSRYPLMEIRDAIKLCYQNEFGPGHMVSDYDTARSRILAEWQNAPKSFGAKFEPIGNGLVRAHLGFFTEEELEPLTLRFVTSANISRGNLESFNQKLQVFISLCKSGKINISARAAAAQIEEYRQAGCPQVSHSEAFRQKYRPCYRVIDAIDSKGQ